MANRLHSNGNQLPDPQPYSTRDTALAAYLCSEEFKLVNVDNTGREAIFYFENSSSKLEEHVRSYLSGKATVNVLVFFHNYKHLLSLIHRGGNDY